MTKTLMITGATDGIGLETAKRLARQGHRLLLHGRNSEKLQSTLAQIQSVAEAESVFAFQADLSRLSEVESLATQIGEKFQSLDALINNAGVFVTSQPVTEDKLDARFVVNTVAPYLLSQRLMALFSPVGRIVNVASAAQAPVNVDALCESGVQLENMEAYAQSKLALIMWTRHLATERADQGPVIVSVNPASLLGSKMVKDAFGVDGKDLGIGADILIRAALDDDFANAHGQYFDNDIGDFGSPHPDALDAAKCQQVADAIETLLQRKLA